MQKTQLRNSLLLFLTAAIWGTAFVAQSVGMDYVGPFTFNAVRSLIGGIVLIPCIFLLDRLNGSRNSQKGNTQDTSGTVSQPDSTSGTASRKNLISSFQQMGIQYTTVGRAGFITACYIVIVPVLSLIFLRKNVPPPSGSP